jgi:hypothetical protein
MPGIYPPTIEASSANNNNHTSSNSIDTANSRDCCIAQSGARSALAARRLADRRLDPPPASIGTIIVNAGPGEPQKGRQNTATQPTSLRQDGSGLPSQSQ